MIGSAEQGPAMVTSAKMMEAIELQASVAVANPSDDGAVLAAQSTVRFVGQVTTGGVLSCTTIICVQVAVFMQLSVAVQVRVIVYSAEQDPGAV
jgi:hypothetical protein